MMYPKPVKPVRGTADAKRWLALVAAQPCVICGGFPVVVHHCISGRLSQRKASDFDTIPLCPEHHDSLHHYRAAWEATHGPDTRFLPIVRGTIQRYLESFV